MTSLHVDWHLYTLIFIFHSDFRAFLLYSRDTRPPAQPEEADYDADDVTPLPPGTEIARGTPDPPPHSDPATGDSTHHNLTTSAPPSHPPPPPGFLHSHLSTHSTCTSYCSILPTSTRPGTTPTTSTFSPTCHGPTAPLSIRTTTTSQAIFSPRPSHITNDTFTTCTTP